MRRCPGSHRHPDVFQCAVAAPSRSKPVRDVPKAGLEDRFSDLFDRALYDAVADGGDTQGAELPWLTSFRNETSPAWARSVSADSQILSKLGKKGVLSLIAANGPHRYPVDSWRSPASIRGYASPSTPDVAWVGDPIPQLPVCLAGVCLAPLVQLPLHAEQPGRCLMIRVHGSLLRLRKRTCSLPPFALCAAFPRSDYYGGSAPTHDRPRSPRVARVHHGRSRVGSHVPALDLWILRRHALPLAMRGAGLWRNAQPRMRPDASTSAEHQAAPIQIAISLGPIQTLRAWSL
jgi:hypothetical protein